MAVSNKSILQEANAAIATGDTEAFLASCADDILWTTVGEGTLRGKQAVRDWMKQAYADPPEFTVSDMIAEGDMVVAMGTLMAPDAHGTKAPNAYCDVWRFRDGRMVELKAFVVGTDGHDA